MTSFYEEFKNHSKGELNKAFVYACGNGELDKVKYLINSPELKFNVSPRHGNDVGFKIAFSRSQVDVLKYLTNPKNIRKPLDTNFYLLELTYLAAKEKDLTWLEELLPAAIKSNEYTLSLLVANSCSTGNLDTLKYLLNSPTWGPLIRLDNSLFNHACRSGNVNIIDYFLNSKWKENIDIHFNNDMPFLNCCGSNGLDAAKYFIFNLNIPKSSYIDDCLKLNPDTELTKDIEALFNQRTLKHSLENDLLENKFVYRKNKI